MNIPRYITQLTKEWIKSVSKKLVQGNFIRIDETDEERTISVDVENLKNYIGSGNVSSVDGHEPDANGAVSFGLTASKWVVTDANGHIHTTNDTPVTVPEDSGYVKSDGENLSTVTKVPVSDVDFGRGVMNVTNHNVGTYISPYLNGVLTSSNYGNVLDDVYAKKTHSHTVSQITDLDLSQYITSASMSDYVSKSADFYRSPTTGCLTDSDVTHSHLVSDIVVYTLNAEVVRLGSYFTNDNKIVAGKIKLKSNGGLTADSDGLSLADLSPSEWVKTTSNGRLTTVSKVPVEAVDFGQGVENITSDNISEYATTTTALNALASQHNTDFGNLTALIEQHSRLISGKANSEHSHATTDITGLNESTILRTTQIGVQGGVASFSHTHSKAQITDLDLSSYVTVDGLSDTIDALVEASIEDVIEDLGDYVDKSTDQTIGGNKTFSSPISVSGNTAIKSSVNNSYVLLCGSNVYSTGGHVVLGSNEGTTNGGGIVSLRTNKDNYSASLTLTPGSGRNLLYSEFNNNTTYNRFGISGNFNFYSRSNGTSGGWWNYLNLMSHDNVTTGQIISGVDSSMNHDAYMRAIKGGVNSSIRVVSTGTAATCSQLLENPPSADNAQTNNLQIAWRGWVNQYFMRLTNAQTVTGVKTFKGTEPIVLDSNGEAFTRFKFKNNDSISGYIGAYDHVSSYDTSFFTSTKGTIIYGGGSDGASQCLIVGNHDTYGNVVMILRPSSDRTETDCRIVPTMGWVNTNFFRKDTSSTGLVYNTSGTISYKAIDANNGVQGYSAKLKGIADNSNIGSAGTHSLIGSVHTVASAVNYDRLVGVGKNAQTISLFQSIDGTKMVSVGSESGKWVKTTSNGLLTASDADIVTFPHSQSSGVPSSVSRALVTIDADGQLTNEIEMPDSAPQTDKVLTVKANSTALSWEDAGPSNPGSSATTLSSNKESDRATTGNWTYSPNGTEGIKLWVTSRVRWTGTELFEFRRLLTFTKGGILYSIGDETEHRINTPMEIRWS